MGLSRGHGRDTVLELQIGLRPPVAGLEQGDVAIDDLATLLSEGQGHLFSGQFHIQAVNTAKHAQREHVFPATGILHYFLALPLHRDLNHLVACGHQLVKSVGIGRRDPRIGIVSPLVLQQDGAARLELSGPHAAEQDLLVESHHQIGFVAAIGDPL